MWKLGFRILLVSMLLAFYCQVTHGIVQAKRWFQPDTWHGVVERVCRDGAIFASVNEATLDKPATQENLGQVTSAAYIQVALYANPATLPELPSEEIVVDDSTIDTPISAYGDVIAAGTLRSIYQTTPFTYTQNGSTSGPFYDYATLQLNWSLDPTSPITRVVIGGVTRGLFYVPIQDCYLNAFSYQGNLNDGSGPANGAYDFQFGVYDDSVAGELSAPWINKPGVIVTNGMFGVELPIAPTTFSGAPRWLEIRVKVPGVPDYTTLSPRQQLTAVPNALYAQNAHYANTAGYSYATRGITVGLSDTITLTNTLYITATTPSGVSATDGINIIAADEDGVQIGDETRNSYPTFGLYIPEPGVPRSALLVNTANSDGFWALATPDKIFAGGGYFTSLTLIAQVAEGEALTAGDLVAAVGLGVPLLTTNNPVPQVRRASEQGFSGVIGVVEGRMTLQPEPGKAGLLTLQKAEGPAQPGEYVALTVYGVAQVKAQAVTDVIVPGQRLTAAQQPGTARLLRTETLNGMVVSEGAPVIGVALAPVDPATGLVPVFVTLR